MFNFYNSWNFEDIFVLVLIYNFVKIMLVCLLNETIWGTQFFNKKIGTQIVPLKSKMYFEYILKLKNINFNLLFFIILKKNN